MICLASDARAWENKGPQNKTTKTYGRSASLVRLFRDFTGKIMGETTNHMHLSRGNLPGADALSSFFREDETKREFSGELRNIMEVIARTGKYWHDWDMLKSLFSFRLKQVLKEYYEIQIASQTPPPPVLIAGETYSDLVKRLDEALNCFIEGPPFTLQRLSELLLNSRNIYPDITKASLALEKTLLVTSTIPRSDEPYPTVLSGPSVPEGVTANQQPDVNGPKENGNQETSVIVDEEMVDAVEEDGGIAQSNGSAQVEPLQRNPETSGDKEINSTSALANSEDAAGVNK